MTKKIHVCIPCRGEVNADSFAAIMDAVTDGADYWKHRFGKESHFEIKVIARAHVVDARVNLTKQAVEAGVDYILWLDDDMVPPRTFLESLMQRMDEHPEYDYIGGLAYKKSAPFGPCAFMEVENPNDPCWVDKDPARVQKVAVTGFACLLGRGPAFKAVFDFTEGRPFVYHSDCGEDKYFFIHAHKLGQKLAVDTGLIVGHVGSHVFNDKTWEAFAACTPEALNKLARVEQPVGA